MSDIVIPKNYKSQLNLYETQVAIKTVKDFFQGLLAERLHLLRVSAPLFVDPTSGLNDNLNGVERPVNFHIAAQGDREAEIVQSLAKWKRYALQKYGFKPGEGLYTDMSAIRQDETTDNIHSIYVDQWDWEKIITAEQRNTDFLKETVRKIAGALESTRRTLMAVFPELTASRLGRLDQVTFVTTQELEDRWPDYTPKERENAIAKEAGTVFLMGIGGALASGKPHDGRAPDYDDWALNGDLLCWDPVLNCAVELSSMGIRVSPESLDRQLTIAGCDDRRSLPFHKALLAGELPLTMGGGIGQSRLCLLLLGCAHIGQVQSSVWDADTRAACAKAGVPLL